MESPIHRPNPNTAQHQSRRACGFSSISLGGWVIVCLAIVSSLIVAFWPVPKRTGTDMWIFSRTHALMYEPVIADWNQTRQPKINLFVISSDALARRMMSGFLSGTPVADLIEVERSQIGKVFAGPLEDVGFVDLTERLKSEGIYDQMNEPSFSPWSSRGHIFGLPHDVHPVMLAYRADIVEAAGIDVTKIETWDDFVRIMRPLVKDTDGDGTPDQYPINIWHTAMDQVEVLILQAGGNYFDDQNQPIMDSDINAKVLATVVTWVTGPNRIAADAPEFSASGNQLRLQGYVVCSFMPDWLCGVWKSDLKGLSGKIKLMPLPAWEKGGLRTSVWGGTMLGIPKSAKDFEKTWAIAKYLYLNEKVARKLYESNNIISPVKKLWASDFYDVKDPFFCDEAPGRMYIGLAPHVPRRTSSPYNMIAKERVQDALIALRSYANDHKIYDVEHLMPEAHRQLRLAQDQVQKQMDRNVFMRAPAPGPEGTAKP